MKLTEEQYQKIVEIADEYRYDTQHSVVLLMKFVFETNPLAGELTKLYNQALAIANPLTREWAHDNFVEKEKKCVWTSKKANSSGKNKRLFWQMSSKAVRDYFTIDENAFDDSELLTESEIKAWGYNPEMFDREEIKND